MAESMAGKRILPIPFGRLLQAKKFLAWWALFAVLLMLVTTGCSTLRRQTHSPPKRSLLPFAASTSQAFKDDNAAFAAEWVAAQRDLSAGNPAAACERLRTLVARRPQDIETRLLFCDALLAAGQPAEALAALQPLESRFENDPRLHHLLGLVYEHLGLTAQALVHHEKALLLDPDNEVYLACYEGLIEEAHHRRLNSD